MTNRIPPRSDRSGLAGIEAGRGAAVLLIHGVGLRAEAWNSQIDFLAERYRVRAMDIPGHGDSPTLAEAARSLSAYTDRFAAELDQPTLVIGHSLGAMIALDLSMRYPDRIRGVAALNAVYRRGTAAAQAVRARAAGLTGSGTTDPGPTLKRWFGSADSSEAALCRDWLKSVPPEGYRAAYTVFANEDGPKDSDLRRLACPALFLTGAEDPNSTPSMSRTMAELVPQGRSWIVAGAAHMMPMTHPDAVNIALLHFAGECNR